MFSESEKQSQRRLAGVIASITFMAAIGAMVGLKLYNYYVYNFQYIEVLVPKNEKLVTGVSTS